jgi:hypothetical protein
MFARTAVLIVLLFGAAAFNLGCAQCQQTPDALAASALDERLFTRIASVLGENSPDAASQGRPRTPGVIAVSKAARNAKKDARPAAPTIQQVAAAEPLEAAAPMPEVDPIEAAPLPAASPVELPVAPAAKAKSPARSHAETCDDACCEPGIACPLDRPCPILGACRECPACLVGRRCGKLFTRPEPGPPPVRYRPAMPPKFLPVPTQPVLSPARPEAPDPWHGDVEFSWRPEVTFPGND